MGILEIAIGSAIALFFAAGFARPTLFGAAHIRVLGFLRFWERKMIESREGYADIKDAKIEQLGKSAEQIMDDLATVRGKVNQLKSRNQKLQTEENDLIKARDSLLDRASDLAPDSEARQKTASQVSILSNRIEAIDKEQAVLNEELTMLTEEIETLAPYMDEVQDEIKKTKMDRELGLLKHDVAKIQEDRARRLNRLAGIAETAVDKLEARADEYLEKRIERGKIAAERTGASADAVLREVKKATKAQTDEERLAGLLNARQAKKEEAKPVSAEPAAADTLSK